MKKFLLILFFVSCLAFSGAAQDVRVDGLVEQDINTSLKDDGVNFQTSYLNKTVPYKDVLVPKKLHDDLNNFKAQFQSSGGQEKLQIQIKFKQEKKDDDDDMPDFLSQYQYQAQQQTNPAQTQFQVQSSLDVTDMGNGSSLEEDADYDFQSQESRNERFQIDGSLNRKIDGQQLLNDANIRFNISGGEFAFDSGLIKPRISSHYEHLIVKHDIRTSVSPEYGRTVETTENVYSGEDTDRIPVTGSVDQLNAGEVSQTITKDNLYEDRTTEKLVLAYNSRTNISNIEWGGLSHERVTGFDYNTLVKPELDSVDALQFSYIENPSDYEFRVYNVTYPENSVESVNVEYSQPIYNPLEDNSNEDNYDFKYYSYIIGSVATFQTDTSSEWANGTFNGIYESSGVINLGKWTVNTASLRTEKSSSGSYPKSIHWKPDGTKMYEPLDGGEKIQGYDVSTPWDIDTASQSNALSTVTNGPYDLEFYSDGTKMLVLNNGGLREWTLSTAYDLSTASSTSTTFSTSDGSAEGMYWKPDGTKFWTADRGNNRIREYSVSTAHDITTASFTNSISSSNSGATDIHWKPDGTKFWESDRDTNTVYEWEVSTAWDITTASMERTLSANGAVEGLAWKPDGTKLYLNGYGTNIDEYTVGSTSGTYTSAVYSESVKKLWSNITISNFDKGGGNIDIWVKTSNDGFSTVLEEEKISSSQLSASGTQTIDLSFSKPSNDLRYNISMGSGAPTLDGISIEGIENKKPVVSLDNPADNSESGNPVTFDFTPECFSLNGCDTAELYTTYIDNVSSKTITDNSTEWGEGTFTDTSNVGEGTLQLTSSNDFKAGTITGDSGVWKTISYSDFAEPVVVGTIENTGSGNGLVFEVRNVGSSSAEIRACDSDGRGSCEASSGHPIHYMVADASSVNSASGIEAGTFTIDGEVDTTSNTASYSTSFGSTPVPVASVQTMNGNPTTDVRITNADTNGFTSGICEQDSNDGCNSGHPTETVGWIALEPGNIPFSNGQAGTSGNSVSGSEWYGVTFPSSFSQSPVGFASTITNDGGQEMEHDEVRNIGTGSMDIRYCELESGDNCDGHTSENIGWFAIKSGYYSTGSGGFISPGRYTSKTFSKDSEVYWNQSYFKSSTPSGTSIQADFGTNKSGVWTYYDTIKELPKTKYIRFNTTLTTTDSSVSPTIDLVNLSSAKKEEVFRGIKQKDTVTNATQNSIDYDFSQLPDYTENQFPVTIDWNVLLTDSAGLNSFAQNNYTTTVGSGNKAPSASISSNSPVLTSEDFGLDASGSSDMEDSSLSYSWDLNNDGVYGDASGTATPSKTEGDNGDYTVTVKVTDSEGATDTASTTVTVESRQPPEWRNLQDNVSGFLEKGGSVNISAEFKDEVEGLSSAVLATNETGEWSNRTGELRSEWNYTGYDGVRSTAVGLDDEGNVYTGSYDRSKLLKISSSGDEILWTYSGYEGNEGLYAVEVGPDGGVYAGGSDGSVTRFYSENGSVDWESNIRQWVYDIDIDDSGNVYASHDIEFISDRIVTKFSPDGTQLQLFSKGGVSRGAGIAVDKDENVYVGNDQNVTKFDSNGNEVWSYKLDDFTVRGGVDLDSNGNVYAVTRSGVLRKLSSQGQSQWSVSNSNFRFGDVIVGPADSIYTGGAKLADVDTTYISKFSPQGNQIWNYTPTPDADSAYDLELGSDGTIYAGVEDLITKISTPYTHLFSGERKSWELSDFDWRNSSFSETLGYKVWGQDEAGNWNATDVGSITVNSPPVIESVSFVGRRTESDLSVSVTASDVDGNIESVYLNLTDAHGNSEVVEAQMVDEGGGSYSYSYSIGSEPSNLGDWSAAFRVEDSAGTSDTNTSAFTVYDGVGPEWRNLQDNVSGLLEEGGSVNISAEFRDNGSGLEHAFLATNETGSFKNWSEVSLGSYSLDHVSTLEGSETAGIDFSSDGSTLIQIDFDSAKIYEHSCSVPFNISNCSYTGDSISTQELSVGGVEFGRNGEKLYEASADNIYGYICTSQYDISSCYYSGNSISTSGDYAQGDVEFSSNGGKMFEYVVSGGSNYVFEHSCSTKFKVSSCSYNGENLSVQGSNPSGISFTESGRTLVTSDDDFIYRYQCSTGFDVSTCSYTGESRSNSGPYSMNDVELANNGLNLYDVNVEGGPYTTGQHTGNYTYGPYLFDGETGDYKTGSILWRNSSFSETLGYKVWGQDEAGNWNVTDVSVQKVYSSYNRSSSTGIAAADTLDSGLFASSVFSGSTSVSSSSTNSLGLGQSALQGMFVSDSMFKELSLTSEVSEVLGISNVFSSTTVLNRFVSQGVGAEGVVERALGVNRSDIEQLGVADLADPRSDYTEGVVREVSVVSGTTSSFDLFRDPLQQVVVSELLGDATVFADSDATQAIGVVQNGVVDAIGLSEFSENVTLSGVMQEELNISFSTTDIVDVVGANDVGVDLVRGLESNVVVSGISGSAVDFFESGVQIVNIADSSDNVAQFSESGEADAVVLDNVFVEFVGGRTIGQSIEVSDSVDRNISVLDSAAEVVSTDSSSGVVNSYLGVGLQDIGVSDSVVRDIVLSRAVASSPIVSGDVDTGLVSYFDVRESMSVASSVVRNIDIDYNLLQVIGLTGFTSDNTAPRVENVTVQVQNVGEDREVTVRADIQDIDGSNDREKVTLGDREKEITGGMGRNIEIDVDDSTSINQVLTAYDDSGATTEFLLDYSITDNLYRQKMGEQNNLSVQYINISNEFTAGNMMAPVKVNFSHATYGGENLTNSYNVKTLSSQGETLNITTEVKGDFLDDTLQWHTREDKYNTVDNQSIAATVNVSTVIDYLDWSQVQSGKVESPDPFGACDDCSSKAISIPVSGFSSEQLYTDTGDGVGDQFEQDIKDVVLGERNQYWDEYRYYNISDGVEFRDVWVNVTVDESETEYTKPFIRIRDNNTFNNTFIPSESQSCSTISTDVESFTFNNDTWSMCSQDLNNTGVPEYFRLKIPHFSEYNIRFGLGEAPEERFAYRESDPCPDSLEGDKVGSNSSLVCHQNLVMTPSAAQLEEKDVSRVIGQGISGLLYIVVFILALVVVFFTTRDEDDGFSDLQPF